MQQQLTRPSHLACEEEQLDDSPASQERKSRILAEIKVLNEKCRELRLLMEQSAVDPPEAAPAPAHSTQPSKPSRVPQFLPKFRDGDNSIQEPEKFLHRFKRVLEAQSFDVERQWYRFLILCLSESNARWVEANLAPSLHWEAVTSAFTRQFGDPCQIREVRVALFKLQMRPGETIAEYSRRFQDHMRLANVPNSERGVAAYFLTTLPHALRYHINSAISQLEDPEPTVDQLISIALSFAWKPSEARAPVRSEGPKSHAVPHRHQFCQLHGLGTHPTEQCRSLQARKRRANPGATDAHFERPSSSSATADPPAPTVKVTCYRCDQKGHYANECRQKTPVTQDKPSVRRMTVVASREDDDSCPANEKTIDRSLTLIPVLLNGQKHTALLDSGATCSLISKSLADELGATIEPKEGSINLADVRTIPRTGVTSPIRTQTGSLDTLYRYEVIPELAGAQLFIGNDLINRVVGPDYLAGKFTLPGTTDDAPAHAVDAPAHAVDAPAPLVSSDFNEEEESSEFQAFRETVVQAIAPELAANAAISRTSFCPLPEAEVRIPTEHGKVTFRRQYPLPQSQRTTINAKLKAWLDNGVIEVVDSPSTFNTPFFLVQKKDPTGAKTDFRICHDFRPLNMLLPDDKWPLPLVREIFEALAGAQVFSTLDLWQAYHRFPIAEDDRHKTAFTWNGTQYQFRGAPFGLKTLPSHFQRVMAMLLHDLDYARVFIDDVVVFSKSSGEHAMHLREVIRRLNEAQLILNVDKCHFARLEVNLLGFRINPYGRKIDPSRLVNLAEWPVPASQTAAELPRFRQLLARFHAQHRPSRACPSPDTATPQLHDAVLARPAVRVRFRRGPPSRHPQRPPGRSLAPLPTVEFGGGECQRQTRCQQQRHQCTGAAPRYGLQDGNRRGLASSPHGSAKGPTHGHHSSPPPPWPLWGQGHGRLDPRGRLRLAKPRSRSQGSLRQVPPLPASQHRQAWIPPAAADFCEPAIRPCGD